MLYRLCEVECAESGGEGQAFGGNSQSTATMAISVSEIAGR
jgi:hypothetical protein